MTMEGDVFGASEIVNVIIWSLRTFYTSKDPFKHGWTLRRAFTGPDGVNRGTIISVVPRTGYSESDPPQGVDERDRL